MVISAITALYVLNVEQTAIQWFWMNGFFGMAGQSKSAEYDYANIGPIWSYLVTNINAALLATTADTLLVSEGVLTLLSDHDFADCIGRYGGAITYGIIQYE